MAFDGSGNYVLSDTIAPATNADANELQAILTDIQNALDACVVADGQSTITGPLKGADGTAALPAYAFAADLNTGIYRIGSDNIGISCGGTKILDLSASGISGTYVDPLQILSTDAGAGAGPALDLYRNSASPAVSDVLGHITFTGNNSAAAKKTYADIQARITDPVSTSEDGIFVFLQQIAGAGTTVLQSSATAWTSALIWALTNVTNGLSLAGGTTGQRNGSPTAGDTRYNTTLNGLEYWNGTAWIVGGQKPTVQRFTSGSGNYTTPANVLYVKVTMCGPGAGGAAATTNNGTNGTANTSFGSWTAVLGQGGVTSNGAGGIGGTGGTDVADASNKLIDRVSGGVGAGGSTSGTAGVVPFAGSGGNNPRGGAGAGGKSGTAGTNAAANSGGGGGGGGATAGTQGGGGGGAGEWVQFYVYPTAAQVIAYVVGAAGAGGGAGVNAGGNGAAGIIVVEEFYS